MKKILLSLIACALMSTNVSAFDVDATFDDGSSVTGSTDYNSLGGCQVLNVTAGGLANLVANGWGDNPHYTVADFDRTTFKITGTLNSDDLAAIQSLSKATYIYMKDATLAEGTDLSKFATSNALEYVIFPSTLTDLSDLRKASLGTAFCAAVASGCVQNTQGGTLAAYVKQEGTLNKALMFNAGTVNAQESWGGYWHKYLPTTMNLAGNLNALDLIGNWPNNANNFTLAADGHLYYPSLPDGVSQRDDARGSWENGPSGVTTLDLTYANFSHINDMSLSDMGYTKLTTLSLPIAEDTIPVNCLNAVTTLEKLCVPDNYKVIQATAFPGSLNHITTTGLDEEGNVIEIDNGPQSITLSAGLEKIESHAFYNVTHVKDVYCLKLEAPICELDAFSTMTYYANNTIEGASNGAVTRDSYCKNGGEAGWMAILHFPAQANTYDLASRYTDVTRDFSISTGEYDGRGNLIMFPNFSELNRAFVQACTGYTWNSTIQERIVGDPNRPYWLEPLDNGSDEGCDTGKSADQYKLTPNGQQTAVYQEELYGGWHQFLIASYSPLVPETFVYNTGNIYDNEWWTICLPIPLTKQMMLEAFGDPENAKYPKLCRFTGVDRIVDEKIVLRFGVDLVAAATSDDAVVLEAGRPYMIKPYLPSGVSADARIIKVPVDNLDLAAVYKTLTVQEQITMLKSMVEILPQDAIKIYADLANYKAGVEAESSTDTGVNAPYTNYTFVGSFWKYSLPQFSYFLGWDSQANKVRYFWKYSEVDLYNRDWNTCTSIICPNWKTDAEIVKVADGVLETVHWDLTDFSQSDAYANWGELNPNNASANVEFAFDCEGDTDGINNVHVGNGMVTTVKGAIYNLNGQMVSDGDTSKLAKGIYVVGGKKFVVK